MSFRSFTDEFGEFLQNMKLSRISVWMSVITMLKDHLWTLILEDSLKTPVYILIITIYQILISVKMQNLDLVLNWSGFGVFNILENKVARLYTPVGRKTQNPRFKVHLKCLLFLSIKLNRLWFLLWNFLQVESPGMVITFASQTVQLQCYSAAS